jgi:NtrC-family two-component system sensor histidine kinase KinB
MTLKRKLSLGLGFLFFIIFALGVFYSLQIGRLSQDAENIVKDNYNSLVYSRNMVSALDDMRTALTDIVFNPSKDHQVTDTDLKLYEAGRAEFEDNLKSEKNNITEIQEREYVDSLSKNYVVYAGISSRIIQAAGDGRAFFGEFQPAFAKLRHTIGNINDLNMQAVERKNLKAKSDAAGIINLSAGIGVVCLILAFFYFWYFPLYVSNTIAYLAERMKALLKKAGIVADLKTRDEAFVILEGIDLLENKLGPEGRSGPAAT